MKLLEHAVNTGHTYSKIQKEAQLNVWKSDKTFVLRK